MASSSRYSGSTPWVVGGVLVAATGAAALLAANHYFNRPRPYLGDAPQRSLLGSRSKGWRENTLVGRTVTIDRPRHELYAFWRNLENLPHVMENVEKVIQISPRRSEWTIKAPGGGSLTFQTLITEDRPGDHIAWESTPDAPITNSGRITFRDAPDGRGTEVEAIIAYDPPGGTLGQTAAKILQREPNIQARRELKRFKQLMETGEISVAQSLKPAA
jgi:uncharacterized membrane protein